MLQKLKALSNSTVVHLFALFGVVFLIAWICTLNGYIFGNDVDWVNQHSVFPDFFRQNFYETGELFPEFAPNLGAGENLYYFAYHGFLNPFYLISYLLPWVDMVDYVIACNFTIVVVSGWLFYWWMRKKDFTPRMAFIAAWFFVCASPLIYHAHKQVMFVQYMPFLILAYMGIDRLYEKGKKGLLSISVFLIFMTSYFFAISALFALTFYAVYKYINTAKEYNMRTFFETALHYAYCLITGVCMAGILLIPSFYALLAGRTGSNENEESGLSLLIPKFPLSDLSYSTYGIGVLAIIFFALLYFILHRRQPGSRFMAMGIFLFTAWPVLLSALNGFLYARSKALIPFLPLACYMIGCLCCEIRDCKLKLKPYVIAYPIMIVLMVLSLQYRASYIAAIALDMGFCLLLFYLAQKKKNTAIFLIPYCLLAFIVCLVCNKTTRYLSEEMSDFIHSEDKSTLIEETLAEDTSDTLFRSSDMTSPKETNNMTYGNLFYTTGFYSSASNSYYRNFCFSDLQLTNPTVNPISVTVPNDVLYQRFMGVKYLLVSSKSPKGADAKGTTAPAGYEACGSQGDFTIYKNDSAYGIGFGTNELMSLREWNTLDSEDKEFAILRYIVVDQDLPDVYTSPYEDVTLDVNLPFTTDSEGDYTTSGDKTTHVNVTLPDSLKDYLYVCETTILQRPERRACIRINGVQNVLSGRNAVYPNDNFNLKFMISESNDNNVLSIDFVGSSVYEGTTFTFKKVSMEVVDAQDDNLDFIENASWETSNHFTGTMNMTTDGYFATTLPYDEGFTVTVDGTEVDYECVDNAFLGFPLTAGTHQISITFHAPFRNVGILVSIAGIIMFLGNLIGQAVAARRASLTASPGE